MPLLPDAITTGKQTVVVNAPQFDISLCRAGAPLRFFKTGTHSKSMASPFGLILRATPLMLTVLFVHTVDDRNATGENVFNVAISEVTSGKVQFEVME